MAPAAGRRGAAVDAIAFRLAAGQPPQQHRLVVVLETQGYPDAAQDVPLAVGRQSLSLARRDQ
ncbi:hypothetical protein [Methylobacterium sp. ap11]|uniref:hypothetical protein n=1 Tax=Methylobacterium sp. ap11 TaxID=1761799 RepID=UPI000B8192B6|nr:hypothetical protein [Methylobacterium sp. ap11]